MLVTDNGQPSLTATQTFQVQVLDTLPDAVVGLGTTNVSAGQTSNVRLTLDAGISVTNVAFEVEAVPALVGGFTLQSPSTDGDRAQASCLCQPRVRASRLPSSPRVPTQANRTLMRFGLAASGGDVSGSAELRKAPSRSHATTASASPTPGAKPDGLSSSASVRCSRWCPEAAAGRYWFTDALARYVIECTTNLGPGAVWVPVATAFLSANFEQLSLPSTPLTAFYRAREAGGASLQLLSSVGQSYSYQLTGQAGGSYVIECSTNPAAYWTYNMRVPLSNATQQLLITLDSSNVVCRVREFIANPPLLELREGERGAASDRLRPPQRHLPVAVHNEPRRRGELADGRNPEHDQFIPDFLTLTNDGVRARFYRLLEP